MSDEVTSSQEEGKKLTPRERALHKARIELGRYTADFEAAGITAEQIAETTSNVEQRINAEYEQREKEDPFRLIEDALNESAQTTDDKEIAAQNARWIEWRRTNIAEAANTSDSREMQRILQGGSMEYDYTNPKARVDVLQSVQYPQDINKGVNKHPSREFQEAFLRSIGVLEDDQTMQDLIALPSYRKGQEGPYFANDRQPVPSYEDSSSMTPLAKEPHARVSTNIPGVTARIAWNHDGSNRITAVLDKPAMQRVANNPK